MIQVLSLQKDGVEQPQFYALAFSINLWNYRGGKCP
jgi:hypothetical protein